MILALLALSSVEGLLAACQEKLVVHEWGTFTVLQDETGRALPGVNINEEALPPFVERLGWGLVPDSHRYSPLLEVGAYAGYASKGIPRIYPAAAMRMETPVIYFYLPKGRTAPWTVDVEVKFRRGWISEWFPQAAVEAPGFFRKAKGEDDNAIGTITPHTVGAIRWNGLTVGGSGEPPKTDTHVWLAPRAVPSALVTSRDGFSERYLFYRGIADLPAPLSVVRPAGTGTLEVRSAFSTHAPVTIRAAWLADISGDRLRFRALGSLKVPAGAAGRTIATTAATLDADVSGGLGELMTSMRAALTADGLTVPEADALLSTWKLSYFTSDGLRLFFTLPRSWTDEILPLKLSEPADIERVMVGRIEIVTPEQRALIATIAKGPASDRAWFNDALKTRPREEQAAIRQELYEGRRTVESLGLAIPADYGAFMELGRFRDALVLDAARDGKRPQLAKFAMNYGLEYFQNNRPR